MKGKGGRLVDCKKTGAFIAELRKEAGLTQVQLAEMLGVTGGAVSKWERGLCYPDIELVGRLAESLSVSANEILAGERLEELTRETADTIVKESVKNYGAEIRKRVSRKSFWVTAGVLLVCVLFAVLPSERPPSGIEKVYAEYCEMYHSETADIGQMLVQYDLNGERRTAAVSVLVEKDENSLRTVNVLRRQIMEDGRWPMTVTAYCNLKSAEYFQVVLAIFVQGRDKDDPITVMEVFDIIYRDGGYMLAE